MHFAIRENDYSLGVYRAGDILLNIRHSVVAASEMRSEIPRNCNGTLRKKRLAGVTVNAHVRNDYSQKIAFYVAIVASDGIIILYAYVAIIAFSLR